MPTPELVIEIGRSDRPTYQILHSPTRVFNEAHSVGVDKPFVVLQMGDYNSVSFFGYQEIEEVIAQLTRSIGFLKSELVVCGFEQLRLAESKKGIENLVMAEYKYIVEKMQCRDGFDLLVQQEVVPYLEREALLHDYDIELYLPNKSQVQIVGKAKLPTKSMS